MNKAEYVFEKLSFPKVLKNMKDISKYKSYIQKPPVDVSKIKPTSTKKAIKTALNLLMKINS